ncbi:MAG TPA: Hsp20/alpha crystallin family protein [Pseudogracilibacillus sp.]|nr:Hsp20/alpha crystallin family protein [Pseudogracilibacillus sp.]
MAGLIPFNRKNRDGSKSNSLRPFDMIDNFFDETFSNLPTFNKNVLFGSFKVDVSETKNEYVIEAELPDIKREEINIALNENRLTISVERKDEQDTIDEEKSYIHKERHYQSMQRSIYLGNADSDSSKADAKLEDGLLKVIVPKDSEFQEPDESQKIEIN